MAFISTALLLVLVTFVLYLLFLSGDKKQVKNFKKRVDELPGPYAIPILGTAWKLVLTNPKEIFANFYRDLHTWGPVFRFWIFDKPSVVLMRARDLEPILQSMTYHVKSDNYRFLHRWMGQGLLTSRDEKWRTHRKILTPAFHFNILHEFLPIFNKHAVKLTECLAVEKKAQDQDGFNIFHYSSLCALDIICESSMGTKIDAQTNEKSPYVKAVIKMNELVIKRYFTPWLRLDWIYDRSPTRRETDRNLKIVNNFTDKVIEERRQYLESIRYANLGQSSNDESGRTRRLAFIDLLLAAQAEGSEHVGSQDLRDQVSTFMFEGHDTVSTATCWALFLLGTYPDIQEQVVAELDAVFGDSGRQPELADFAELKYLERCIKESMRLYPSVPFIERQLETDAQIENHVIPAGCTVSINKYMLHRDPEFWPDPEKFDPDRFLPDNVKGRNPYAFLPFSAGPRNCIGQKFALMEEKVVVSTVIRRFRVEAAHSREEAQLTMGMVLRPENGLSIRLYDRESHPKLRITV